MNHTRKAQIFFLLFLIVALFPLQVRSQVGWLSGWGDRKTIYITGSAGAGTDYQIRVTIPYHNGMQADWDDLRFTDDDGTTELDFWIEANTTNTEAIVWVEVADNLDSNQTLFMYWGNDAVSTTQNGTATFLFYEDWSDATINTSRWDILDSAGTPVFIWTDAVHGRMGVIGATVGTAVYRIESDLHMAAPFALRFRSNIQSTVAASQRTLQGTGTAWDVVEPLCALYNDAGAESALYRDDDGNTDTNSMNGSLLGVQTVWECRRNGSVGWIYANDLYYDTGNMDPDTDSSNVAIIYVRDSEYVIYSDWILAREWIESEPVAVLGTWNDVDSATLFLHSQQYQWGLNALYIFLGLVMIPTSTMYFVRGGKEDMSRDKLFYFLIAFVIGWSLVIGGIMP